VYAVSEPTYLIRVEHDPTDPTLPWAAKVYTLADDTHAVTRWGSTEKEAVEAAQVWMRARASEPEPSRDYWADESGEIMVGESVRVLRP